LAKRNERTLMSVAISEPIAVNESRSNLDTSRADGNASFANTTTRL
jgi:hypothetical protein